MDRTIGRLLATALTSVVAFVLAAALDSVPLALCAALIVAVAAVGAAVRSNATAGSAVSVAAGLPEVAKINTTLLGLTYAWGGSAILAAYVLTDLFWHHAWQYGSGMILVALGLGGLRWHLGRPQSTLRQPTWTNRLAALTALQAVAAAAGLVFLVASGKLFRLGADWIANVVFVSGGIIIVLQSLLAVQAHRRAAGSGKAVDP